MTTRYTKPPLSTLEKWEEWTGIPLDVLQKIAVMGLVPEKNRWNDETHVRGWGKALIRLTFNFNE